MCICDESWTIIRILCEGANEKVGAGETAGGLPARVGVVDGPEHLSIVVEDDGPGIPESDLPRR